MSDTEKQSWRTLQAYKSAVLAKNVDAFMHLYAPDARIFDTWGHWSYEDAAGWRVAVEGWFSSLGAETCKVTFDDVQIVGDGTFAAVSAIVTYAALSAENQQVRAMQNRISWVLRVSGHQFRIVHEHTSAPIGFEDSKAILERARPY